MKRLLVALLLVFGVSSCVAGKNASTLPSFDALGMAGNSLRFASEQRWGGASANRWEPVVAADPSSSWVYQMTTGQRPDHLWFRASSDGGRTWRATRHICRRGTRHPFQYDPQLAVTGKGAVDAICLDGFLPGVVFTQSLDHGQRWSKAVRLDRPLRYSDKPELVVSPSGKDVYVAFNSGFALYVASSHDGGATWQQPVKATSERLWYYAYAGTEAADGSIWFAVDGEAGHNQTGDGHVELVTSADGGVTWRTIFFALSREGAPCQGHDCYPDFYTAQDAIAVDSTGAYVFIFARNSVRQGPNALYASRSSDGAHWSRPTTINALGNNTSPAIVAARPGDFRLVWQDSRNGARAWNTWFARSRDAGETWGSPVRLSDRSTGEPYKSNAGYVFPFGDYLDLSVDSHGTDYVIWGEGAHIYYPGSTWWTRD